MATKFLFSGLYFRKLEALRRVADLAEQRDDVASSVEYLYLGKFGDIKEALIHRDEITPWMQEMRRLVRLLPNLIALQGSAYKTQNGVLSELTVSHSTPPFVTLRSLSVGADNLAAVVGLVDRASPTLVRLGLHDRPDSASPGTINLRPSTYPSSVLPRLHTLMLDMLGPASCLMHQLAAQWTLPSLNTVTSFASLHLLAFLGVHGEKVVQLGLLGQAAADLASYHGCLTRCPNLRVLALQVSRPTDVRKSAILTIDAPITSVETINISQGSVERSPSNADEIDPYVPELVTKANFPALVRVRFSSHLYYISKRSAGSLPINTPLPSADPPPSVCPNLPDSLIPWFRALTEQGVEVEWT